MSDFVQCAPEARNCRAKEEEPVLLRTPGGIVVKTPRVHSVTVKTGRRMFRRPGHRILKCARVATARIQNGQPKIFCAWRRHCYSSGSLGGGVADFNSVSVSLS
jgi:hypothetical protein